jgi:hypothetical protein
LPDGEARLPSTAVHSFRLSHAEPPDEPVLPAGRTLGAFAAAIRHPEVQDRPLQRGSLGEHPGRHRGLVREPPYPRSRRLLGRDPIAAELAPESGPPLKGVEVEVVD